MSDDNSKFFAILCFVLNVQYFRRLKSVCNFRLLSVLPTQNSAVDKIEKNEMGGACGTHGGRERCAQRFGRETLGERDHWGDQDVDGRIILRWIFRKWEGVVGTGWSCLRMGTGGGRL